MNKLIFIILSLLLTACSSSVSNINNDLYKDGKELAQTLYDRTENNIYQMDDNTDNLFNKFDVKYDLSDDKWSEDEKNFLSIMNRLKRSYLENHLEQTEENLSNFYDNIERLKTEYGVNF